MFTAVISYLVTQRDRKQENTLGTPSFYSKNYRKNYCPVLACLQLISIFEKSRVNKRISNV